MSASTGTAAGGWAAVFNKFVGMPGEEEALLVLNSQGTVEWQSALASAGELHADV